MPMHETVMTGAPVADAAGVKWETDPAVILPEKPDKIAIFDPKSVTVFNITMQDRKNDKVLKKPGEQRPNPKRGQKPNGVTVPDFFRHTKINPTPHAPTGSKKCGN